MLGDLDADLGGLERQLACRHYDQRLDLVLGHVDALEDRDDVGAGFAGAVLGSGKDVAAGQRDRNARLLDWGGRFPALLEDAHEKLTLQAVVLELVALGRGHVARFDALVLHRQVEFGFPASLVLLWPIKVVNGGGIQMVNNNKKNNEKK